MDNIENLDIPPINFACGINSYVTPACVLSARRGLAESAASQLDLTATEDRAVVELATRQKAKGLGVICDGSLRWTAGPIEFFKGFVGVTQVIAPPGAYFATTPVNAKSVALTGPIDASMHPVIDEFRILNTQASDGVVSKQVLVSPSSLFHELMLGGSRKRHDFAYPSEDALAQAIAHAYQIVLDNLYTFGCRFVQFDDYSLNPLANRTMWEAFELDEARIEQLCGTYSTLIRESLEHVPHDMAVYWRIANVDYHTGRSYQGSYEHVMRVFDQQDRICALGIPLSTKSFDELAWLDAIPSGKHLVLEIADTGDVIRAQAVRELVDAVAMHVERTLIGLALGATHGLPQQTAACCCTHGDDGVPDVDLEEQQ